MTTDRYRQARDRGADFLLQHLHADGSFGNPEKGVTEYYKVPSAFLVSGHSRSAGRLLDWIRRHGLRDNGDFGPRPAAATDTYYYTYYNAWVIKAAHRMGQFDLSQRGMDFLMGFCDAASGGFYSSPTQRTPETKQDLWVVAGSGWSALYTGRMDVARHVGHWMNRLLDAQPNYPEVLYSVSSAATGLITEVLDGDDFRYVLSRDESRDQSFYHPGIAAGFLARLYQATGEDQWLGLARQYLRFAEHVGAYHFRLLRAGKVGWAAAVLYTLTGEAKYRNMAIRVGDELIAQQTAEGYWNWPAEDGSLEANNDITAEMVVWLDEIHQAIG
ncbi:MAG TPA: hypothetical protein EYQ31_02315 [Candidatus Handelsmanbacteria bacterium]|nr:hypothetical protein [Candidatus Handelsmanbacteria bacterium]